MKKLKYLAFILLLTITGNIHAMEYWKLVPHKGIESESIKIHLGMSRKEVAKAFSKTSLKISDNDFDSEDDYEAKDGEFIRCRFEKDKLSDIELLNANIVYEGIPLHNGTDIDDIKSSFANKVTIRDAEWLGDGQDFVELGINIATHEDVGGDGNEIEWVILSKDFK